MTVSKILEKMPAPVRESPRKAGALALLVAVMVVLWARVMLGGGPSPARAAPSPQGQAPVLPAPAPVAAGVDELQEWVRQPLQSAGRNLFAIQLENFPSDGTEKPHANASTPSDGFWDDVAKSMALQADQKRERQILVENLRLQARQLQLQSTIMGPEPKAMVNGKLVGEGDVVALFRVLRIEARGIVVEREGVRLEILMK